MMDEDEQPEADDGLTEREREIKRAHAELVKPVKSRAERDKEQLTKFLRNHPKARKQYLKQFGSIK